MMKTRRATSNTGPWARNPLSPFESVTRTKSAPGFCGVGLQPAVLHSVAEVDHKANPHPHAEPQPVGPADAVDIRAADDDSEHRDQRQRRDHEATRNFG